MRIREFELYVRDLLDHPEIQRLRQAERHHFRRNRFEHSYAVAKLAWRMTKVLQGNAYVAARAGLLHDWYHDHDPHFRKWFRPDTHHFRKSVAAATAYGEHDQVIHAIRTHYWPYGRMIPRTREAWMVWMADNLIWVVDGWQSLKQVAQEALNRRPQIKA